MKKKILKIIFAIIATIFLGALGSGLWERFLSKAVDKLVTLSVSTMAIVIVSYKDSLYLSAAKGFHEYSSVFLHTLLLSLIPAMYVITMIRYHQILKGKKEKKQDEIRAFIRSNKGYYVFLILTISVVISFFLSTAKITYTNTVVTYSLQSIEILSRYMPNDKYMALKSSYYSIKNADDFYEFNKSLKKIANSENIELPKFNPL